MAPVSLPPHDPRITAGTHMLAVLAAAGWVSASQVPHGEWAIFVAAAVVTGDLHSTASRTRDLIVGVLVEALGALVLTPALPHDETRLFADFRSL